MPVIYPKSIRRKFSSLNLEKIKESLNNNGFKFVREGGFRPEDEPFKFSNYLFYFNKDKGTNIRIGYYYPFISTKNLIFEICYAEKDDKWWTDVTPNFSRNCWKEVSDLYKKENGKFVKVT
jgi:hypothetical protein